MMFEVEGENRLGITKEILGVLADAQFDVSQVEVITHHVYCDVPDLTGTRLPDLRRALLGIPGIRSVTPIDIMPGERRRMQLHTVLAALRDPVLSADVEGMILQANAAAAKATDLSEEDLRRRSLPNLFGDPGLMEEIRASGFQLPVREVALGGTPYLMNVTPMRLRDDPDAPPGGCVVLLQPAARVGALLSTMQQPEAAGFDAIIGDAPPMRALKERAKRVAAVDAPLMILGETGVGKEMLARACHEAGPRQGQAFLALNCAALPEGLAESELFGYAPGAFTSAGRSGKPGLFELADQGTVFLDEVGELSPYLQAKLLRFLQDGSFRRVGGTRELTANVRIISATNRNLEAMIADGSFREDLYYRLNVLSLNLPPLRDRPEDIPQLARYFLDRAAAQVGLTPPPRLTGDGTAALAAYSWPGNVRQLENVIFRAASLAQGPFIEAAELDLPDTPRSTSSKPSVAPDSYAAALAEFEAGLFRRLYPAHPSSRKLAERLGVSHTTVAQKLKRYGIPEETS